MSLLHLGLGGGEVSKEEAVQNLRMRTCIEGGGATSKEEEV